MTSPSAFRYARNGDVRIAYQTVGRQASDLLFVPGFVSNIEVVWENPVFAHTRRRLAAFARAIYFDKRGTGLSDRDAGIPSLDERVGDVLAVMDAAESVETALVGVSEGGAMSAVFAAMYPERVSALVLWDSFACLLRNEQQPWAVDRNTLDLFTKFIGDEWGTGGVFALMSPGSRDDPRLMEWNARYERMGASPGAALALMNLQTAIDVRWVLTSISVPTLVVHRTGNPIVPIEHAHLLANAIPNAKLVELRGGHHVPTEFEDDALDCIEEFLTGASGSNSANRVLATVLFSDIVSSTDTLAKLGDRHWRAVLETHEVACDQIVGRQRGRIVKTTGDGIVAVFASPGLAITAADGLHDAARKAGIELRIGVHIGEIEVRGEDIAGMTVHIAARAMSKARADQTLVTRTVTELLAGSSRHFEALGEYELKGVPGSWPLFAVAPTR